MSLLLRRPTDREPPALLPLSAAVAVCDVAGPDALVKWPNDVVVRRPAGNHLGPAKRDLSKLAGILIEGRPQEAWLALGIGLNVAVDLANLPEDIRPTAATMGRPPEAIEPTLTELLQALGRRFAQPAPEILKAWRSRDALLGSPVASGRYSGVAEGIDDQGCLLVRTDDGSLVGLDSGEVA
jgi:BirA family biotin operon repressor/biotin-[acetyl-CoA-carboxylase] ligase